MRSSLAAAAAISLLLVPIAASPSASAEPGQPAQSDPRITPGQVIDGWGMPIPCRCLFQGQAFKLGDVVCMNTPVGTVLTRCELFLNNTSWMPSQQPCTISQIRSGAVAMAVLPRSTSPAFTPRHGGEPGLRSVPGAE